MAQAIPGQAPQWRAGTPAITACPADWGSSPQTAGPETGVSINHDMAPERPCGRLNELRLGWGSRYAVPRARLRCVRNISTDVAAPSPTRRDRPELRALTSLRGIAAMAVVLQHFSATAQEHCVVTIPSLVPHGYVAVDFFFVLSGFIMAYTYLASFERLGTAAYRPFLAKRFARIVPLNLAVLLVIGLLGAGSVALAGVNIFFQSKNLAYDFAANALMLQGLGIGTNLNGPSW